jgi:predicted HTH domain antitoxin
VREGKLMQITLNLPDSLNQIETFNQNDWFREIAIALFQQERISLSRASKIAGVEIMDFQKLLADRGICVHYDVAILRTELSGYNPVGTEVFIVGMGFNQSWVKL